MADEITIRSLGDVSLETAHRASIEAFADYLVDVQMSLDEFEVMVRQNSVDLALSVGAFDGDRLIGIWVNGVRTVDGLRTAYDSGTAIVAAYRGRGLSKRMSHLSTRLLREAGVVQTFLEVLQQNEKAYGIYLADGFEVVRELKCLRTTRPRTGEVPLPAGLVLESGPFDKALVPRFPPMEYRPSWQNATASMMQVAERVHSVVVRRDRAIVGYGLVMPARGRVTQLGVDDVLWESTVPAAILRALCGVARSEEVAAINVDPAATRTLALLRDHGFEPYVDQYEMSKPLST